ncbi:MAG: radical SAM protein, partial [Candidatus Omnitrophica bacterium]|nr:radical SAM protein [Candidatus Omnitrophota bacterium]
LLINAPYIDVYGPIKLAAGRYFPLGLGYIAAVLRDHGFTVRLIDPEAQSLAIGDIADIIRADKPMTVGISSATPNFSSAVKIAGLAKEIDPGIKVVAGGIHASALPELVLEQTGAFDIVVIGEGENTMVELARAFQEGTGYEGVAGIAYRKQGIITRTAPRPFIQDVDSLPLPARDLIDIALFFPNLFNIRKRRTAGMITSRGCPFKCYFCASHITMGAGYRPHSSGRVFDELSMLVRDYGVQQVLFMDDTFTFDRKRLIDICERILRSALHVDWHCFARVSDVDKETLALMEKAGCSSIGFGVESGDEEVLKGIKKGITLGQVRQAFALSNLTRMRTQAFFVFGSKHETNRTIDTTISLAKELKPHLAFFNILTPYPGTRAFDDIGIKDPGAITNWDDFVAIGPRASLGVGTLSNNDLVRAMHKAYKAYYLRLGALMRILCSFRSWYEFFQYVKGGMALVLQMVQWRTGGEKKA